MQRVFSCGWLIFIAAAFTSQLVFEPFQARSKCKMSEYPSDIFHVSFSSGPWLESLQCLISLASPAIVCKLSRHRWRRPHLKTISISDHQGCPWLKNVVPCTQNIRGSIKSRLIFLSGGVFTMSAAGNQCPFFFTGGSTSGGSSCRRAWIRKGRWMDALWLVEVLITPSTSF